MTSGRTGTGAGSGGWLRVEAWRERARGSLFLVPMLWLVAAAVLGQAVVWADSELLSRGTRLPLALASTVESARAVLTTVATATVTVAGIAFSVALLVIQLASSQYSPRVIHGLFRDPFNKVVMGIVVGTFAYCLVVLKSVHGSIDNRGDETVPSISITIAVILGIVSLMAIVAFINHSAHTMEVSEILQRITDATAGQARRSAKLRHAGASDDEPDAEPPSEPGFVVRCDRHGWLQQLDEQGLLAALPPGGTARLDTAVGRYVIEGAPLCTLWPVPSPGDDADTITRRARASVHVGRTRTMQQDLAYGIRQLVDVALKALSPGVNDPTTAQDAIFHATAALGNLLNAPEPSSQRDERGARLVPAEAMTHEELIALTYDEVRRDAASRPTVCVYLLESLHLLSETLESAGGGGTTGHLRDQLRRQAELVVEGCEQASPLPADLQAVQDAFTRRFTS